MKQGDSWLNRLYDVGAASGYHSFPNAERTDESQRLPDMLSSGNSYSDSL
jgi:hypothetical protein